MLKLKFLFLLFTLLISGPANACKCIKTEGLKEAIQKADKIFLGVVKTNPILQPSKNYFILGFSVSKAWKGVNGIRTQIKVGRTSCSYSFVRGKKYLVFSSEHEPKYTWSCGRTKLFGQASKDISLLGASKPLK